MVDTPWRSFGSPDQEREYLVLLSSLPLKGYRKTMRLLAYTRKIQVQLADAPGLIGYSVRAKLLSHRFWTLSVWDGEPSLMAFVAKAPHRDAMRALRPHMGETDFTRWTKVPLCRPRGRTPCGA